DKAAAVKQNALLFLESSGFPAYPIQISGETRSHQDSDDFGKLIRVRFAYQFFKARVSSLCGFDQQRHFGDGFDVVLPTVSRDAGSKLVDASSGTRFDKLARKFFRRWRVGQIGDDQ